ncbi:MAG: prepilin-type N-terminal cleavage/methylation domain-containing protein [Phycisphaera sp.]|nr:prepilin-type N-terminal cleavage/methylation domain-containing protein [Phycisphaera sp.]
MQRARGFTIVELLVVISIILLLVAILLPSIERSQYQANLTKCAANLRQLGVGVMGYASDNLTFYPARPSLNKPTSLKNGGNDYRPALRDYVPFNALQCPLSPDRVDFDKANAVQVEANYGLWWSWRYNDGGGFVERGMYKLNDVFTFRGEKFDVLAGDWDAMQLTYGHSETSHIACGGDTTHQAWTWVNYAWGGTTYTFSRWNNWAGTKRKPIDENFLFNDGGVRMYGHVSWDHAEVPEMKNTPVFRDVTVWSTWLPQ